MFCQRSVLCGLLLVGALRTSSLRSDFSRDSGSSLMVACYLQSVASTLVGEKNTEGTLGGREGRNCGNRVDTYVLRLLDVIGPKPQT
jgi:hypothetical protein